MSEYVTQQPKWSFDDSGPSAGGWQCDAPWMPANGRYVHKYHMRYPNSMASAQVTLGRCYGKDMLVQLFRGEGQTIDSFTGFQKYFDSRDPAKTQCAVNVIDGGGRTGPLSSIYFVCWSPRGVYMVSGDGEMPLGTGINDISLVVKDLRYVARVANLAFGSSCEIVSTKIAQAMLRVPILTANREIMRPMLYMHPTFHETLGCDRFRDIPIRDIDFLTDEGFVE
jgi:hypothetical protein